MLDKIQELKKRVESIEGCTREIQSKTDNQEAHWENSYAIDDITSVLIEILDILEDIENKIIK